MKDSLVIADAGPIFSLAIIGKLDILNKIFREVIIPNAVWKEVSVNTEVKYYDDIYNFFKDRVRKISGFNDLTFVMDYGESESVILYKETDADFFLVDDRKARKISENFGIKCIGTIGLLHYSKSLGIVKELRPLFVEFIRNKRYYSLELLNGILIKNEECILN